MINSDSNITTIHSHHNHLEIIEFFDKVADNWDSYVTPETLLRAEKLLDKVPINSGDTIIDIGSGTGILVPYLMNRLQNRGILIELDISSKMLRIGMGKYSNEHLYWLTADGHFLPIINNSVDVVICYGIFPHFTNKEKAIKDIARVLKQKGYMAICHSKSSKEINNIHKNIGGVVEHHTIPEFSLVKELFDSSGLHITHFQDSEEGYLLIATKQ